MESKQHKQALSNLQNKIGDKDVNHFTFNTFRSWIRKSLPIPNTPMSKALSTLTTLAVGEPRVSSSQLKSCAGDQLIAKRRAEKFKRIKCSTLANLLRQNGSVEESIY